VNFLKFVLLTSIFSLSVQASAFTEDVLEIADNHKVYFRYQVAKDNMPTIVLLNGLIYSVEHWDEYFSELATAGYGVVQVSYSSQPESLRYLTTLPFFSEPIVTLQGPSMVGLETQTLVDEVMGVLDRLEIQDFSILSLSYSSIVSSELAVQNKERVKNLILIGPAVRSAHRYNAYGQSRHAFYTFQKSMGGPADYYYDLELYSTMSLTVAPAAQGVKDVDPQDFFHGVYQMARSSKWFDLKDYADADLPPTYLFLATREDPPLLEDQKKFWTLMTSNPAKKSLVTFRGAEHALPGVAPEITAKMTIKVINGEVTESENTVVVSSENPGGTSGDTGSSWRMKETTN